MQLFFPNRYPEDLPLSASLQINPPDGEGWHTFTLTLGNGQTPIVQATQYLSRLCLQTLLKKLQEILSENPPPSEYEPVEPSFLLRLARYAGDIVEMLFIADLSFTANGPATGTGTGILMHVDKAVVKEQADLLQEYLSST